MYIILENEQEKLYNIESAIDITYWQDAVDTINENEPNSKWRLYVCRNEESKFKRLNELKKSGYELGSITLRLGKAREAGLNKKRK